MIIYVVDDEKNVLEETRATVLKAGPGADIRTFMRGKEALLAITDGEMPDIVFSDIEMPGISGLEFATQLKKLSPNTRILFVTCHENYALQAFKVKVHGYLLKPLSVEDVREELEFIPRGGADKTSNMLEVRCFGHFDVYYNGKPVIFTRKQSKELFAYLIDREGAACSSAEIAAALWRDESDTNATRNRIRVLVNDLRNTLKDIGMSDLVIRDKRELAIRKDMIDCDYYRMLEGDIDAVNSYRGEYMVEYEWAELTNARLYFRKKY